MEAADVVVAALFCVIIGIALGGRMMAITLRREINDIEWAIDRLTKFRDQDNDEQPWL